MSLGIAYAQRPSGVPFALLVASQTDKATVQAISTLKGDQCPVSKERIIRGSSSIAAI